MKKKLTISTGKELSYLTNAITDVFITKDYTGELIAQYGEHVDEFHASYVVNDFGQIVDFYQFLAIGNVNSVPYETPLDDLKSVEEELRHILDHRTAYMSVLRILMKRSKPRGMAGSMVHDLLHMISGDCRDFKECATRYDRYLGETFPVTSVISTVYAYGKLSGLVDYYNFKEGKDVKGSY